MPSWPLAFTITGMPCDRFCPLMPAIKVAVWVPCVPMRIVFASPATPALPISILLLPVVRLTRHQSPMRCCCCRLCC